VAALGGDGFEAVLELAELDGQAGQEGGVLAVGAVLVDGGAQVGSLVAGGRAGRGRLGQLTWAWAMSMSSRSMAGGFACPAAGARPVD